jgi:hypothetical protein
MTGDVGGKERPVTAWSRASKRDACMRLLLHSILLQHALLGWRYATSNNSELGQERQSLVLTATVVRCS